MFKTVKLSATALAVAGLTLSMPASAAPSMHAASVAHEAAIGDMSYEHGKKHKKHKKHWKRHHRDHDRYDDYRYSARRTYYEPRRTYYEPRRPYYMGYARNYGQPVYANTRVWRGDDGRYYCRKSNGTTGLLVGAGVGALIGTQVAGRGGDRTLGAILGGAAGALLGRSIDRNNTRCG